MLEALTKQDEFQYLARHLLPENLPQIRNGMNGQLAALMGLNANRRLVFLNTTDPARKVERHLLSFVLKHR